MEDKTSASAARPSKFDLELEDEEVDTLSFCNLPIGEINSGSIRQSPRTSSDRIDQHFQFYITSQPEPDLEIIFCGKIIHEQEEQLNEYQKRDYFATIKSQSFREPDQAKNHRGLSSPTRFAGELIRPKSSTRDLSYHTQRVNITSLTSMSAKSKRRMFMFGPVKFKPEMELTAIKQRQARQREQAAVGGGKNRLEVVRSSLTGRSHIAGVLARSFGCIPMVSGVAN